MLNNIQFVKRICDKDALLVDMSALALFIGMFECFAKTVIQRVEVFFCDPPGKGYFAKRRRIKYQKRIKNRVVDKNGNRDTLKASMLWFSDVGAITEEQYEYFLHLKKLRNSCAHEMTQYIWEGLPQNFAHDLIGLFDLFAAIDRWWINEVEIPISGKDVAPGYDEERVMSLSLIAFGVSIKALYCGNSEEYLQQIDELLISMGINGDT